MYGAPYEFDKGSKFHNSSLDGNEMIEAAINAFQADATKEKLCVVMDTMEGCIFMNGKRALMIPEFWTEPNGSWRSD